MLGSHLLYQKTRQEAQAKIESEKQPFWLRTYSKVVKNQQGSAAYQKLLKSLRPWEGGEETSDVIETVRDERWGIYRERPRNAVSFIYLCLL